MRQGQGSLEIIFVLGVVIILSFLIVGKFFSELDNVFTRASARSALVGELEKLDKKYYFVEVETTKCLNQDKTPETRIVYFLDPTPPGKSPGDPPGSDDTFMEIASRVVDAVVSSTSAADNYIFISYNTARDLVCYSSSGAYNGPSTPRVYTPL